MLLLITFMAKLAQSDQNIIKEPETQEFNSPIISNETITPVLSYKSNKVTFYSWLEFIGISGLFDIVFIIFIRSIFFSVYRLG